MREAGLLYDYAKTIPIRTDGGPSIDLCMSHLPTSGPSHASTPDRPKLVLLHGNPSNMHDFGPLAAQLRSEFELLALDLPGFGRSQNLPAPAPGSVLTSYAHHVHAALARAGWTRDYYVLGHSHGAGVAQTLAALYPDEIAGLALLASIGTPAHWGYRQLVVPGALGGLRLLARSLALPTPRALRKHAVRAIMAGIFAPDPIPDGWIDLQLGVVERRPEILVNMARVAIGDPCAQLARSAAQIRAPTLLIHGDSDQLVPSRYARGIYERMSTQVCKEFRIVARAGHMLQITHPGEVAALLRTWMKHRTGGDDSRA